MSPTVLVLRPGALGDALLTLPALRALRARFPAARLYLIGHPGAGCLLQAAGEVDGYADFDSPDLSALFTPGAPIPRLEPLAPIGSAVAWLSDPDGVVEASLQRIATHRVLVAPSRPAPGSGLHVSEHLLASLSGWGAKTAPWSPLRLPAGEQAEPMPSFDVLVHPGSGSAAKNWPAERFAAVLEKLASQPRISAGMVCGPADEATCAAVRRQLACPIPVLRPASVLGLAYVLAGAHAYLGNDSGVSHLAAALGTPTLAVFGPTDPRTWAPRGPRARVVPFEASPGRVAAAVVRRLRPIGTRSPSHGSKGPMV